MLFSNLLITCSAIITVNATMNIGIHDINGIAVVLNIGCRNGMYIAHSCSMNDPRTASISVLFFLLLFDLQLNTLNNWYTTNTVNAMVLATRCVVPRLTSYM